MSEENTQNPTPAAPAAQAAPAAPAPAPAVPDAKLAEEAAAAKTRAEKLERELKSALDKMKKLGEREASLRKAFLGEEADAGDDPKTVLERRAAEEQRAKLDRVVLENTIHRHANAQRLVLRDEDPDFADFVMGKVQRDPELSKLATEDPKALVEALKERKLLVSLTSGEDQRAQALPPTPRPARTSIQSTPPTELETIKSIKDFAKLPPSKRLELETQHPEFVKMLRIAPIVPNIGVPKAAVR